MQKAILAVCALLLSTCLIACGSPKPIATELHPNNAFVTTILAIQRREVTEHAPKAINVAIGATAGGVIGHQVGKGQGKTVATVAGVIAGALVGSQINQSSRTNQVEKLTLSYPNGTLFDVEVTPAGWQVGQTVSVQIEGHRAVISAWNEAHN